MGNLAMAVDGPLEPVAATGSLGMADWTRPPPDISVLEGRIGYAFRDRERLIQALTHVSAASKKLQSYQRLEFLGDRVLGLAICDLLYRHFPQADEGELSRRLARMVRRESCAEVAVEWNVGVCLRLGGGEAQSGGRAKNAILADVCESIIGAVFLDGGYGPALKVVEAAWGGRMMMSEGPARDAKTTLQEWAQGRGLPPPEYREVARSGPDHAPSFTVAVAVSGHVPAEASGASKRAAEQAAAEAFAKRENIMAADLRNRGAA
jgi:ribonuclease-3